MKKTYSKPLVVIENFSLNQTIAQNCGAIGQTSHWSKTNCGYYWGDEIIWVDKATGGCTEPTDADAEVNAYCYNTPTANMQIFSS